MVYILKIDTDHADIVLETLHFCQKFTKWYTVYGRLCAYVIKPRWSLTDTIH